MADVHHSTRTCRVCNEEKQITEFYTRLTRHGKIWTSAECKTCTIARVAARKRRIIESDPAEAQRLKVWRREHKRAILAGTWIVGLKGQQRKQRVLAKRAEVDARKSQHDSHIRKWKTYLNNRELARKYRKTPVGTLNNRVSVAVRSMLTMGKEGRSWQKILGYNATQLKAHIEKQFVKGMSWDNMDEWHIDHIIPRSSFKFDTVDDPEFLACWALTNLRPLWAGENIRKSNKVLVLL